MTNRSERPDKSKRSAQFAQQDVLDKFTNREIDEITEQKTSDLIIYDKFNFVE